MRVTFLGTSHGVPEKGRYCQSILFETGGYGYLVDAGAPVMDCLIGMSYPLEQLKAVFITHMHNDHTDGLTRLLELSSWHFKNMAFQVYFPDQKGLEDFEAHAAAVTESFPNDRVSLFQSFSGTFFRDEILAVTAWPNEHMKKPRLSYGYLLEAEGRKVYVTGDLNGRTIDYPEFLQQEAVDILIVECAHFSAESLLEKLKDCKARSVVLVHVFPQEKYPVLREGAERLHIRMICPNDGDSFEL